MGMNQPTLTKDVSGRVADRLTVLLGLNGLLIDGAFGTLSERPKNAVGEMLQVAEELRTLLDPFMKQQ
jgi:hypothetical protein